MADFSEKHCWKCKKDQPLANFSRDSTRGDGLRPLCRSCCANYDSQPHIKSRKRAYYAKNKEKISAFCKLKRESGIYVYKETCRNWSSSERGRESQRKTRLRNKDKISKRISAWKRLQHKTNPRYRILANLRSRIHRALVGGVHKSSSTVSLLGCSIDSFKIYLESKFEPGMSWENYNYRGWHIDHIVPCALFDLTKPQHQKICFHFSNMQPMWGKENIKKSDNYKGVGLYRGLLRITKS